MNMIYKLQFLIRPVSDLSGSDPRVSQLFLTWIIIMIAAALICFLVSEITRNYSQVDKLWSLMPVTYGLVTLVTFPSPRIAIMCILVIIWGFRLSYNFYRKGGYNLIPWKGEEDYRWNIIRQNKVLRGRLRFGLFNFFFISLYQHILILLFSSPLLLAAINRDSELNIPDIIALLLMITFILTETIADNQLFRFQQQKRNRNLSRSDFTESLKKGFISEGLWQYVRHPNFASEQAIWLSFYLFGVGASGKWINWTLAGPLLLILLFLGSTGLTERISSEKYPEYAAYKKNVPKFLPRILKKEQQKKSNI